MNFSQKIEYIRKELQKPLPGRKQQYLMAPEFRGRSVSPGNPRNAAVMICLFPEKSDLQMVFIKRPDYEGPHGGQVSFPGGVYEGSDNDLAGTAIRETYEEIGIACPYSSVLGALTPLMIPVSNMNVYPFVGYFENVPEFRTDPREVDYLIIAGINELLDPSCIRREVWNLHGMDLMVPYYSIKGEIIWGATAMMLSEFLYVISRSGLYPQFPG